MSLRRELPNARDDAPCSALFDPRARLAMAFVFAAAVVAVQGLDVMASAAGAPLLLLVALRRQPIAFLQRYRLFASLIVAVFVLTPWRLGDVDALFSLGSLAYSYDGMRIAAAVSLKGTAILAMLHVLLCDVDLITLGHAIERLGAPRKLARLMLFVLRYAHVLHEEQVRIRRAMRVRGFQPRMDRRTFQTYAHLAGMLLVRAVERSERVFAAMRCRGFRGAFPSFHPMKLTVYDLALVLAMMAAVVAMLCVDWMGVA